jgi:hypothetical protein
MLTSELGNPFFSVSIMKYNITEDLAAIGAGILGRFVAIAV